jgi:hypothetical protein
MNVLHQNILLSMYNCEEVLEILKNDGNIIILGLQDINLENDYDIDNSKQDCFERYQNKKLIFF